MRLAGIVACLVPVVVAAQGGVKLVPQPGADPALGALLRQAAEQCIPLVGSYLNSRLSGDLEILLLFGSKEAFAAGLRGAGTSPAMAARLALMWRTSHEAVAAYFRSARPGGRDLEANFRRAFSFGVDKFQSQLEERKSSGRSRADTGPGRAGLSSYACRRAATS